MISSYRLLQFSNNNKNVRIIFNSLIIHKMSVSFILMKIKKNAGLITSET